MGSIVISTLVNNGLKSEGLPALTSGLYSGTEDAALILQQKANEANRELAREHEWPQLVKKGTITLVAGTASYTFPTDFDSWIFNTNYNQNDNWALGAPMSQQEEQERNYSYVSSLNRQRYVVQGYDSTNLVISPTPDASDAGKIISFYYTSSYRVRSSAGVAAGDLTDFNSDANYTVFDDDALRFRIMAHYFRSKGLAYETLANQALERSNERIAAIRGAGTIYCARRGSGTRFLSSYNLPNSGWGS